MATATLPGPPATKPTDTSPDPQKTSRNTPRMSWPVRLLLGGGLAMVPWLFVLAAWLPSTTRASHWSLAWTGFDAVEGLGLLVTGLLLHRGDPRRSLTAAVTATLLVVDAWFDNCTAAPGFDQATAIAMAVLAEIPLAIVCAIVAWRAFPANPAH